MPSLSLRTLLPLLLAGTVVACGPFAPPGPPGDTAERRPVVDMGGSGGPVTGTASVHPAPKPARPAPPPAKPVEGQAVTAPYADFPAPTMLPSGAKTADATPVAPKPPEIKQPRPPVQQAARSLVEPLPSGNGLSRLPTDPIEVNRLRTRPPMTPPVDTAFDAAIDRAVAGVQRPQPPAAAGATAQARCREAVRAGRESVNRYLHLSAEAIPATDWVEEALRVTEVAVRACQGQPGEEAATYWRATAFFLHGQYARAALNYRRVADMQGPFNALGYAANLGTLLQTCGEDRTTLDAFRMAGLFEAAGHIERAAAQYGEAARSACAPLRDTAEARLGLIAERMNRDAATR
ncbi:MAG: hypothetical protein WCZ23_03130 [Rhodospirillaceae bacterium]